MKLLSVTSIAGLLAILAAGCGKQTAAPPAEMAAKPVAAEANQHQHDAWWCAEHGVPEEICGQCNSRVAADFQKKGDWCADHDRPDSQCFVCHPEFEAKFAARYEAKYGEKPPKPEG
jgi:hypothetical protein